MEGFKTKWEEHILSLSYSTHVTTKMGLDRTVGAYFPPDRITTTTNMQTRASNIFPKIFKMSQSAVIWVVKPIQVTTATLTWANLLHTRTLLKLSQQARMQKRKNKALRYATLTAKITWSILKKKKVIKFYSSSNSAPLLNWLVQKVIRARIPIMMITTTSKPSHKSKSRSKSLSWSSWLTLITWYRSHISFEPWTTKSSLTSKLLQNLGSLWNKPWKFIQRRRQRRGRNLHRTRLSQPTQMSFSTSRICQPCRELWDMILPRS